ncbi:head-tail adaptor protein [Clostridium botulinum]|uniref:phage head closure protein n=1 Tax=Clostridium TaxID=1485 RepID=UPI0013CD83FA|nr:phage head closure protein [Clostridium botulinum]MBY6836918.1 phage head closure protein [Clostridium botulinum]NFE74389.1 head-tail adaptor protein [Clostridium botulinum]NFG58406.1 head-tail adaptor protein [Clostridium botulinum]NFG64882.1 head-tail adaptor protein [Clostridium botulinum]NFI06041.1 head-tail adaptor protein [Clostridium botulinum]
MALYIINPGEFKHQIEIGKYASGGVDEDDIPAEKFEVKLTTKAQIINVSGKEIALNKGEAKVINKRFIIRYPKNIDVTNNDIIIYNNKRYNITYPSDIKEQHKYLEIVAELIE